jgi:hypothetical protein
MKLKMATKRLFEHENNAHLYSLWQLIENENRVKQILNPPKN